MLMHAVYPADLRHAVSQNLNADVQVSQRLLAVELAPVLLQTFQDPFAPSPAMGLATPASLQVSARTLQS